MVSTIRYRTVVRKAGQRPLTPEDWARAALRTIAWGGVDAVAVETVAASLGATKGSFYWHFKNRDALVRAALDMWEQRWTDGVIEELEREPNPAERLKKIVEVGFELGPRDRAEIALLANPDHPAALSAVQRVAQRRIAYISEQLEKLGWDHAGAGDRAVVLYYVYVGHLQMMHAVPQTISSDTRRRHVELLLAALVERDKTGTLPPPAGTPPLSMATRNSPAADS
jgi:AcrR family transcriptional regulator